MSQSPAKPRPFYVDMTYMFTGHPSALDASGKPVYGDGSLRPVQNFVLFTRDSGVNAGAGDTQAMCTDGKGLLRPERPRGAAHIFAMQQWFVVPPREVILQAYAADEENGGELLAKLLADPQGSVGIELKKERIGRRQLAQPDRDRAKADKDEEEYARFYDGLSDSSPIFAYVIPRVRAVIFKFRNPALKDASVALRREDGTKAGEALVKSSPFGMAAVVFGKEKEPPPGRYHITVSPRPAALTQGLWSAGLKGSQTPSYAFVEMLRFQITNPSGEFEIVDCDPIAVQDAVMLQCAALYPAELALARKRAEYPALAKLEPEYSESKTNELPPALKAWGERVSAARGKTKLAIDSFADTPFRREVGMAVIEALESEEPIFKISKGAVTLINDVYSVGKDWVEVCKKLRLTKAFDRATRISPQTIREAFKRQRVIRYFVDKAAEAETPVELLAFAKDAKKAAFAKWAIDKEATELEKLVGERLGKAIPIALTAAELGLKAYDVAVAAYAVSGVRRELAGLQDDLRELAGKVDTELHGAPSKEGIGNLERVRLATVNAKLKVDEAVDTAILAALDLTLGVATTVVGGPLLGAVAVLKDTYQLAVKAVDYADTHAFHGAVADWLARRAQIAAAIKAGAANQELLAGKTGPELQFWIRAQAVSGLFGLITRASVASSDEGSYLERIRKYKVAEYVQTYLLADGWQLPLRPLVPLGMDSYWLYATGEDGPWNQLMRLDDLLGDASSASPKTAMAANLVPGGMLMMLALNEVVAGNARAAFQRSFPIHHLEGSVDDLAKALRARYPEVKNDSVAYTCVYTRSAGNPSAPWTPVDAAGARRVEDLPQLTSIDPLRVLVVLDEKVKPGLYSLSLQVVRTDTLLSILGPVYRDTIHPLQDSELLPGEKGTFTNRLGCVVYPFYQFVNKVFAGAKPLATFGGPDDMIADIFSRGLGDMTYALRLKLGSDTKQREVNLGRPALGKSALSRLRVKLGSTPAEQLMAKDRSFLKREGREQQYPRLFAPRVAARLQPGAAPAARDARPPAEDHTGVGPLFARVEGQGPYLCATSEEDGDLRFPAFDWKAQVEVIVPAYALAVHREVWEAEGLDWRQIPFTFNLVNYAGADRDGPRYTATLRYVGTVRRAAMPDGVMTGGVTLDASVAGTEIEGWAQQVQRDPSRLVQNLNLDEYQLFAAHLSLHYTVPGGARCQSLRPFGHMLTGEDFRIGLVNLQTPIDCGLSAPKVTVRGAAVDLECELHFPPPRDYLSGVPWESMVIRGGREGSRERIRRWIELHGTELECMSDLQAPL